MEAKKKRGCNYTAAEKEILLDLIKKHQHIIESKETNSNMILKKREAWYFVCQQYNAVAVSGFRKWHQLRHFYENLKQRSKKNIAKINRERYLESTKELQKKASNVNKEICHIGGGANKSTCTEQDTQILATVTPKIEPLPNPYDDAALFFDEQYTTNSTVTNYSQPCTVTFNTPDEWEATTATLHQECNKPQSSTSEIGDEIKAQTPKKTKAQKKESNIKFEYFKTKFRNAKIENNYLINKTKMEREKHKIEMEILQIKLNKLKCVRKRKH